MKRLLLWLFGGLVVAFTPLLALMYSVQIDKPSSVASIVAPNEDQTALINIMARLYYVENRCPSLQVNENAMTILAASRRFDLDDVSVDGRFRPTYSRAYRKMSDQFVSEPDKTFCLAAKVAFGPDGVKMPNAMKLR